MTTPYRLSWARAARIITGLPTEILAIKNDIHHGYRESAAIRTVQLAADISIADLILEGGDDESDLVSQLQQYEESVEELVTLLFVEVAS